MTWTRAPLTALLVLSTLNSATSQAPAAPAAGSVTERIPLPDPARPLSLAGTLPQDSLIGRDVVESRGFDDVPMGLQTSAFNRQETDLLAQQLKKLVQSVCADAVNAGALQVDVRDGALWLQGSPDRVVQGEAIARHALEAMLQPIAIEVFRIEGDWNPEQPVLDAEATAAVLAARDVSFRGVTRTPSGHIGAVGSLRNRPYIYDLDVEVAQKEAVYDPKVIHAQTGFEIHVQPHALVRKGAIAAYGHLVLGEENRPIRQVSAGPDEAPSMEIPDLRSGIVTFSGVVQDGGALVVTVRSAPGLGTDATVLVRLSKVARKMAPAPEGLRFLPVSALATRSLVEMPTALQQPLRRRIGGGSAFEAGSPQPRILSRGAVLHAMGDLLATQGESPRGRVAVQEFEPWIALLSDPQGDDEALALCAGKVAALEEDALETRAVQVQTIAAEDPSRVLFDVRAPSLTGRYLSFLVGQETTNIVDYQVSIAAEASGANPVVAFVLHGVRGAVLPAAIGDTPGFTAIVDVTTGTAPIERPSHSKKAGNLLVSDTEGSRLTWQDPACGEGWQDLGQGPSVQLGRDSVRTGQRVRVVRLGR